MITGAEKYIGKKLNKTGLSCHKDIIDSYGFIEEHCSDTTGVKITFDKKGYRIKDIDGIKYTATGYMPATKLTKSALEHLDSFISYITD